MAGHIAHDVQNESPGKRMPNEESPDLCEFCACKKVIKSYEELAFHQWTSRGYVFCKVKIPMGTCEKCGARSWDDAAEAMIEQAVRREYERLS
jgi:hypothetical protein